MENNLINRIKNILNNIIEKNILNYNFSQHKNLDFLYKENVKQAFESIYEFDQEIFDSALLISLKDIKLNKNTFTEKIHSNNDYQILVDDKWLTEKLKNILLSDKNNKEYLYQYNNLVLNAIEFNLIKNYFDLLNKKIGNIHQHLDNDISSASASIEKIKSASNFLIDQFGTLPFKDVFELDPNLIDVIVDTFKNKNFLNDIVNIIGKVGKNSLNKKNINNVSVSESIKRKNLVYQPSQIFGVTIGNDLSNVLHYQLSMRSHKKLNNIFKLNYIENKLLVFDKRNKFNNNIDSNQKKISNNNDNGGPFIMCIDTSLSMKNFAEYYSKAFALKIFEEATKQKRKAFIVNFSDKLDILEVNNINNDFDKILKFLKKSFNSGTNIELAIDSSLNLIENYNFQNSDIIVLSDFDVYPISKNISNKIDLYKKNLNTKFFAFVLSRMPRTAMVEKYYDYKFMYNGTNKSIDEIELTLSKIKLKEGITND